MNNAFRLAFNRGRLFACLAAAAALNLPAYGGVVTLNDGNSVANINLGGGAGNIGMNSWTVNNINQLNQQWFWYRVGSSGVAHTIDTIGSLSVINNNNSLSASYTSAGSFTVSISYQLSGGIPGGSDWTSDILESISIRNLSASSLDFHFFQYSDFNLAGTPGGEMANIFQNGGFFTKATVTKAGSQLAETIDQPLANHGEVGLTSDSPNTLNRLNTVSGLQLNDSTSVDGTASPADATWALEWDFSIAGNSSQDVIKDKKLSVAPIPEPGVLALLSLGLVGVGLRRNRRSS